MYASLTGANPSLVNRRRAAVLWYAHPRLLDVVIVEDPVEQLYRGGCAVASLPQVAATDEQRHFDIAVLIEHRLALANVSFFLGINREYQVTPVMAEHSNPVFAA